MRSPSTDEPSHRSTVHGGRQCLSAKAWLFITGHHAFLAAGRLLHRAHRCSIGGPIQPFELVGRARRHFGPSVRRRSRIGLAQKAMTPNPGWSRPAPAWRTHAIPRLRSSSHFTGPKPLRGVARHQFKRYGRRRRESSQPGFVRPIARIKTKFLRSACAGAPSAKPRGTAPWWLCTPTAWPIGAIARSHRRLMRVLRLVYANNGGKMPLHGGVSALACRRLNRFSVGRVSWLRVVKRAWRVAGWANANSARSWQPRWSPRRFRPLLRMTPISPAGRREPA